ncbi:Mu-like prophage major head subunit gpT family protein [Imhoffiella purpurea]|uniref:Mu-like prophage major head subunit gpT n=1 Tax=Imhoffiella purpurea TaxID=1249627 RepID=W9VC83_9GAMM|nr:Mu-like prophage major head subunit gpT family protein [Imhoffiella purpurea]EXJ14596.1 Mu-like prophage major head subunit gpT [Imhoffiella purpurea]
MLMNTVDIEEVYQDLNKTFNAALERTPTRYQDVANVLDTSSITEDQVFMPDLPNWREWRGDKYIHSLFLLSQDRYSLTCEPYEVTIGVKRRDLQADRLEIIRKKIEGLGELAAAFPDERVADAVNASFTAPCWDDRPFFDTEHPILKKNGARSTFSNMGTVALSAASQEDAIASLGAGLTALGTMKNRSGRPVKIRKIKLVVPVALEDIALVLANHRCLNDGTANPYKNRITLEIWPELTNDRAWFLFGESLGLKPFVLLQRKKPTFVKVTNPKDSYVVKKGQFLFGLEADAVAGYTLPQLAFASTGED